MATEGPDHQGPHPQSSLPPREASCPEKRFAGLVSCEGLEDPGWGDCGVVRGCHDVPLQPQACSPHPAQDREQVTSK